MFSRQTARPGGCRLLKAELQRLFLFATLQVERVRAHARPRLSRFATAASQSPWRSRLLELALVIGAYLVYLWSRGLVFPDLEAKGLENAERIVSAEMWLGVFWEPAWQAWMLARAEWLALFFNGVYIFTYWPIIGLVGLFLYFRNRPKYYYYRTVVVINLAFALVIFALFPVTSPFNLAEHFQHPASNTIQALGPAFYGSSDMALLYNAHAAMPSLHFSWTVILGVLFVRTFKSWFKMLGLLYPVLTFWAITLTGNHFILDAVAGGLLAASAFAVMELGVRRWPVYKAGLSEMLKDLPQRNRPIAPAGLAQRWARLSESFCGYLGPSNRTAVELGIRRWLADIEASMERLRTQWLANWNVVVVRSSGYWAKLCAWFRRCIGPRRKVAAR